MSDSIKKYKEMLEDGLIEPSNPSEEYQVWWAKNKDRILAEDAINHEIAMIGYKKRLLREIKKLDNGQNDPA